PEGGCRSIAGSGSSPSPFPVRARCGARPRAPIVAGGRSGTRMTDQGKPPGEPSGEALGEAPDEAPGEALGARAARGAAITMGAQAARIIIQVASVVILARL